MRELCNDKRHVEFSKIMGCPAELIEEIYLQVGVDDFPDREEAHEQRYAAKIYKAMRKSLNRTIESWLSLPELERASHHLTVQDMEDSLRQMVENVERWKALSEQRTAKFGSKGAANKNADVFAEFVAVLFETLERDITFGVSGTSSEPSTAFGRAVKSGLEIYDVRKPAEEKETRIELSNGMIKTDETVFSGSVIDWRRPAKKAFSHRKR